jgi:tRNA uracil 4-sulfurtransferase
MKPVQEALLVRYGEIGLKGGNRPLFEKALVENLRHALADAPNLRILRMRGRLLLRSDAPADELVRDAARVFGVTSLSPATEILTDAESLPQAIMDAALARALEALRDFAGRSTPVRFRITVNRADKRFPIGCPDFQRLVAEFVMPQCDNLVVDLHDPELNLEIDIRPEASFVFARRIEGPGGLPVGTMGRVLCLLSGGIDSPVAAWLAMKRGMRVEFVSFYSFPHVGPQSREKIIRIAAELSQWQPRTMLHMVPFADYQTNIRDHCPEPYRTVLYRRAMQRIASGIAFRRKGKALITGESVGQVASQTLENMRVIEDASTLPVLRPLVTMDKTETIALARKIGTFQLSTLPAPDCCTVFQPESPVIYGRVAEAHAAEASLELKQLTYEAVKGTERIKFPQNA